MDSSRNYMKSVCSGALQSFVTGIMASGPCAVLALSDEELDLCSGAVSQGCVRLWPQELSDAGGSRTAAAPPGQSVPRVRARKQPRPVKPEPPSSYEIRTRVARVVQRRCVCSRGCLQQFQTKVEDVAAVRVRLTTMDKRDADRQARDSLDASVIAVFLLRAAGLRDAAAGFLQRSVELCRSPRPAFPRLAGLPSGFQEVGRPGHRAVQENPQGRQGVRSLSQ